METTVLIALISSTTALAVSLINLINGLILGKRSNRQLKSLEKHKSILLIEDEEKKKTLSAINEGMRTIQRIKDIVWLIVQSVRSSIDHDEIVGELNDAVLDIRTSFEKSNPYLSPIQRRPFHNAKNHSLRLKEKIKRVGDVSDISYEERRKLSEIRRDLTDSQAILSDIKVDILFNLKEEGPRIEN
jgi:hypothetical protein